MLRGLREPLLLGPGAAVQVRGSLGRIPGGRRALRRAGLGGDARTEGLPWCLFSLSRYGNPRLLSVLGIPCTSLFVSLLRPGRCV